MCSEETPILVPLVGALELVVDVGAPVLIFGNDGDFLLSASHDLACSTVFHFLIYKFIIILDELIK